MSTLGVSLSSRRELTAGPPTRWTQGSTSVGGPKVLAMKYDYDLICIGLGPAGMAVSIMASEMGLNVCAIEKHKIGGECMNCGCIPSKALLKIAELRHAISKTRQMQLSEMTLPSVKFPFQKNSG